MGAAALHSLAQKKVWMTRVRGGEGGGNFYEGFPTCINATHSMRQLRVICAIYMTIIIFIKYARSIFINNYEKRNFLYFKSTSALYVELDFEIILIIYIASPTPEVAL